MDGTYVTKRFYRVGGMFLAADRHDCLRSSAGYAQFFQPLHFICIHNALKGAVRIVFQVPSTDSGWVPVA